MTGRRANINESVVVSEGPLMKVFKTSMRLLGHPEKQEILIGTTTNATKIIPYHLYDIADCGNVNTLKFPVLYARENLACVDLND